MASGPGVLLLAVGTKGLGLLEDLATEARITAVVTYPPTGTREPGPAEFHAAGARLGIPVVADREPDLDVLAGRGSGVELILVVGWQRMLAAPPHAPMVVLHDSLLPDLRGFAPTVTALIEGRPHLGVSAILPTDRVDAGPILAQHAAAVRHPVRIAEALAAIRPCYVACARDVMEHLERGALVGEPQDEARATYSLWRDERDYELDLGQDAARVVRTVLALGDPYPGARIRIDGDSVAVHGATEIPDVPFVARQPGKVWRIGEDGIDVVCGTGMVRLSDLRDGEGGPVRIGRLRTRLG